LLVRAEKTKKGLRYHGFLGIIKDTDFGTKKGGETYGKETLLYNHADYYGSL
jgi:hypothetical protein